MGKKKEKLSDLKEEAYNAEDVLDGCFNQKEYNDIPEINDLYTKILGNLNDLMLLIDKEL